MSGPWNALARQIHISSAFHLKSAKRLFSNTNTQVEMDSATEPSPYRKVFDKYFEEDKFIFRKDREKQSKEYLKYAMHNVFLRERPLVSIDVEAWERNPNKITEIGISVYDPKLQMTSVFPQIAVTHLMVNEHLNMKNGLFVPDYKHNSNNGESFVLNLTECKSFIQSVFDKYLGAEHGVLVGHNLLGDIKWLKSISVEFKNNSRVVESDKLYYLSRDKGGSLQNLLKYVDIPHANLHNAANDSYYTLIATLHYCDPLVRRAYGLDRYLLLPPSGLSKGQQKQLKFKTKAELIYGLSGTEVFNQIFEVRKKPAKWKVPSPSEETEEQIIDASK